MRRYVLPESHLGLLQAILMELVKARDPDVEFVAVEEPAEEEATE